jgi:K(+)-stimulated pyrophosphate-energized sodium pump
MSNYLRSETRTDILDSVGNTTAAGKRFAIASAALTSLALFAAYVTLQLTTSIFLKHQY